MPFVRLIAKEDPMITGEINVNSCCGSAMIPVELLDKGPRNGTIWVRARNGLTPFTRYSHGGPFQDTTAICQSVNILNVKVEEDDEQPAEISPEKIDKMGEETGRQINTEDWFLEMAYEDRTCID
jgi:hypothetical protein